MATGAQEIVPFAFGMFQMVPRSRQFDVNPYRFLGLLLLAIPAITFASIHPALGADNQPASRLLLSDLGDEFQFMQEETVVTPLQREQPISEAPSNTYVITAEDIRRSGATDLPAILRQIPGIEVMRTTGADINVSVRGNNQLSANKLLVLIDGRSIFLDAQGGVRWKLLPISLTEIQQIEVIKGPISAVYGFNAFDGVVNILTKSPHEFQGTTLQVAGGEFGTLETSGIQSGTVKNFGYRLSAGHSQNQAWRNRDDPSLQASRFNFQGEYLTSSSERLTLSAGVVNATHFDAPLTTVNNQAGTALRNHVLLSWETPHSLVRTFWSRRDAESRAIPLPALANLLLSTDPEGNVTNHHIINTYDVLAQQTVPIGFFGQLTGGLNVRHITSKSNSFSGFTHETRLGLYAQHQWQPLTPLQVTSLVRYDLDTFINPTISPMLAMTYRLLPNHTIRLGVSVGYRPPGIVFSHLDSRVRTTLPGGGTQNTVAQGSPNLGPERIISYELEYQGWYWQHRLRTRASLFVNRISDLIDFVQSVDGDAAPAQAINGGKATMYGGEVGLEFFLTSWLNGFGNVSYVQIDQTLIGTIRRAVAHTKANAGLHGQWTTGLNADVLIHYVGATTHTLSPVFAAFAPFGVEEPNPRVKSYTLLNLRAAYQFWDKRAELAISVFNALKDRHREHPLGDVIGSRVLGWLTLKL